MSFIRPAARDAIWRFRDVGIGVVVIALGAYFGLTRFGLASYAGWGLAALGLAFLWEGVQRARFPYGRDGAGVVEVTERQIAYFGPDGGGVVSIEDLIRVSMFRHRGLLLWEFEAKSAPTLTIPNNARNAESLFDALGVLSGVDYDAAARAPQSDAPMTLIWQAPSASAHTALH
ncbi:hypothetical protein [Nereida sp. MMG025]|uniref:hypothetical protein n=1 Tax=Nereida sp. MMG025 TaxID=2909981 RepID=UPI001F2A0254|nr:hypothetical protein [Nereida sp. MMG025]MCF6444390.1 hypothetical protein [Nereida sp. MMG025]